MAKWEFAIAIRDEADLPSGHKRKKEGDIIAVKPYPWSWGKKEVTEYLIVILDNLTEEEAHALCQPHYEDAVLQKDVDMETPPKIIGKRRYNIPLDTLKIYEPLLDKEKVRDPKQNYQPFKVKALAIDPKESVVYADKEVSDGKL